jgi:hypothetical protein
MMNDERKKVSAGKRFSAQGGDLMVRLVPSKPLSLSISFAHSSFIVHHS